MSELSKYFQKFESIIERRATQASKGKEHHEKLSSKRLGRATGSNYDKIKFSEEKKLEGKTPAKKDDFIAWILNRREGKSLLDALILQEGKESAEKLNNEQLKQLIDSMTGDFILNDGGLSYLHDLLGQCITGKFAPQVSSESLRWGIKYEPQALALYKERALKENPHLVFAQDEFLINEFILMTGSTPDLIVFDSRISLVKPIGVVENKCPYNQSNHSKTLEKALSEEFKHLQAIEKIDSRYQRQNLGHILNSGALWCDFTSFHPDAKKDIHKLATIRIEASQVAQELDSLERDLFHFCGMLRDKAKKMQIDLETILK
jgi:hypothetical protein